MHIIAFGTVKISITSEDGREQDFALLKTGECFGEMSLLDGANRSATATAVEPVETLVLPREDFRHFFRENPEVAEEITKLLAQRLRNMNEMLGDMVFLDVPTRVAKQLVELAAAYAEAYANYDRKAGQVVIPLGQDELARLVGASRESISRALTTYRREGILTTSHRRITVTDLKALQRIVSL